MRTPLILILALLAISANALKPIEIVNPDALVDAKGAKSNKAIWKALKQSAFSKEQLKMIEWYGRKEVRPKRLRQNIYPEDRPFFKKMVALEVLTDSMGGKSLVLIPAPENQHLPIEIRPMADLYLVVPISAYKPGKPLARLPSIEDLVIGPSYKGLSRFKLLRPENIYGNADLRSDKDAQMIFANLMGYRAVDHLELRCNEDGWPTSMNSLEERKRLADDFKKYKAYALTEFNGKMILIVPAEKNKHISRKARPVADIYLVVDLGQK